MATLRDLSRWMKSPEGENLEFKAAKEKYDFDKLTRYCCALANEGGGQFILGVTDHRPRKVAGTTAFEDIEKIRTQLIKRLRLRVEASELSHPKGRVVVFEVPSRPAGMAIEWDGKYWCRRGEELVGMPREELRRIFSEGQPDFSAEICVDAKLSDLDSKAVRNFRKRWQKKSGRKDLATIPVKRLLEDAELATDGKITNAALLLLGTKQAVARLLPQAELVFEYRAVEGSIPYDARKEFREGFLLIHDAIWNTFNLRNTVHSIRDGMFRREVPAFNEDAVREAILNAFCHRDYRLGGSIQIHQFPVKTEIHSPGGFPPEINTENILFRQSPTNRRLAEACAKCGLVERSGQGVDRMFSSAVQEGKLPPDFMGSDSNHVSVMLNGQVKDVGFLHFLEKVAEETQQPLRTDDLVVLDAVHRGIDIPKIVQTRIGALVDSGVLERVAKKKLVLSRRFYRFLKRPGEYTRKRGLDRDTRKALLLQHLASQKTTGAPFSELMQILPDHSRSQVKVLLRELRRDGQAYSKGLKRGAKWHPGRKKASSKPSRKK